ncbi:MAG: formylmethanofuran dehydrogenase [Deltaproteobacteria bacterium CG23_combo_of_CG06-09_8_20_14_all_60_8]|nr:MAG: formylmethanofuran dehydrogenase [Deltaproteobacteria bacterium CG23_combo_of_CG06-09_8_20_14_all_60_8]
MKNQFVPPEWAFEFHGHLCPFMPIGYRMGKLAMEYLGVEREKDHGFFVFPEIGEGHPQTCMVDGIQAATGATYGKVLMAKTFYGKLAAIFYHPKKGAVRYSLKPEFIDAMGKFEFFVYRKKGVEPSQIPQKVSDEIINWVYQQTDEFMFKIEPKPEFKFTPVKGSFNKAKCVLCGEYVFERYLRTKDGQPVCIPCSGQESGGIKQGVK